MIESTDTQARASAPPAATPEELAQAMASFRACRPLFAALGDPFRQDIVLLLAAARDERLNVKAIAEHMPLSRPAISHHLKVLLQAGLVVQERVSRENFYVLTIDPALAELRRLLEHAEFACASSDAPLTGAALT